MSRPKFLKIQGRRVKLVFKTPIINTDEVECNGLCHFAYNLIEIDSTLAHDETRSTAVHELVHDIESQMGLELTEQEVCSFGSALFAVIRDNPSFFAWLQEKK